MLQVFREVARISLLRLDQLNQVMKESALIVSSLCIAQLLQSLQLEAVRLASRSVSVEVIAHRQHEF